LIFRRFNKSRFIVAILAIFVIGAVSVSSYQVLKPKPARAQCICGELCTSIFGGISTAIGFITTATKVVRIWEIYNTVMTLVDTLQAGFNGIIGAAMGTADQNLNDWFENWLAYDLRPAMQDQTGQLHTMVTDQARTLASGQDAIQQERAQTAFNEELAEAHDEARPSEHVCTAGTMSTGISRARTITKALKRSLPLETDAEGGNEVGSWAENGNIEFQLNKFLNYLSKYCNAQGNGGSGCFGGTTAPQPDADILVEETLFSQDTIDISDATTDPKGVIDDLARNLVEPEAPEVMPPSSFDNPDAQETYLRRRADRTKRALAKKTIYDILATRAPGSQAGTYVQALRQSVGVDITEISPNPSYNEVMNALTEERFQSGVYNLGNVDNPEAATREGVALQSLEVVRLNDRRELMNTIGMIIASQAAQDIIASSAQEDSGIADAPSSN
jgi:hypothetical protein